MVRLNNYDHAQLQQEFITVQNSLKTRIDCRDHFSESDIKTIAGVDLAYWKNENDDEYAVCCVVVIDYTTHDIIEKQQYSGKVDVPYMPGFLAFRELPLVLKAVEKLKNKPDLFMFDGNGYLHPRHMGIATHASFYLKSPTIGIAKTYYRIDRNLNYKEPDKMAGSFSNIELNGEIYGRVLRTHNNIKPVFLSVGNYISLDTATKITMRLISKESHIPIPTRLADIETHYERNQLMEARALLSGAF